MCATSGAEEALCRPCIRGPPSFSHLIFKSTAITAPHGSAISASDLALCAAALLGLLFCCRVAFALFEIQRE
jgi:hypothetical protein